MDERRYSVISLRGKCVTPVTRPKQRAKAEAISAERGAGVRPRRRRQPATHRRRSRRPRLSLAGSGAIRHDPCNSAGQIERRGGRHKMAHHKRVEPLWRRSACRQCIAGAREPDRLIAERGKHFLVGEEAARPASSSISTVSPRPNVWLGGLSRAAGPAAAMQGSQTSKRLPTTGELQMSIAPPCSATISRTSRAPSHCRPNAS